MIRIFSAMSLVLVIALGVLFPIHQRSLAILGDSLSQGYGTDHPDTDAFPWQIHVAGYGTPRVYAQGGATVNDMRARVPSILAMHPDTLVIELGTNDQREGHSPAQFQADYTALLQSVASVPHILCLSLWPSPGHSDTAPDNAIIARLCGQGYVDITTLATPRNTNLVNWHPNTQGAAAIGHAIAAHLTQGTFHG